MKTSPGGGRDDGKSGSTDDSLGSFMCALISLQPELKAFVRYLLPFSDEQDDITQEVNLLVLEKRQKFTAGTNFRAWVFAFARNVVNSRRRKWATRRVLTFDPELLEELADEFEDSTPMMDERVVVLRHCMARLKPEDQALLLSRYEKRGATVKAAERLGMTAGAVRGYLYRLRAALRHCIERRLAEGAEGGPA